MFGKKKKAPKISQEDLARFGKRTMHRASKDIYNEESGKAPQAMKSKLTIGVAGVMPRIGTTTQAIQLALYLFYKDRDVAYVEMNNHGFVRLLERIYSGVKKDNRGNVIYRRLTFVPRDNIASVLNDDYDALVFDYGSYDEEDFDLTGFSERNIQVFVCGNKPEENPKTIRMLIDTDLPYCSYIFTSVSLGDQDEALAIMDDRKGSTFFAEYCPDPFETNRPMNGVYKQIVPDPQQEEE